MERGYFALWRKFQEHRFWQEERVFSKAEAWLDILWETQHKKEPQEVLFGMKLLICNYGETIKSIRTWAKRWGWGRPKVHRFLKLLKKMRQIETVSETVTTRIIVLNYREYDPRHLKDDTQACRMRAGCVPDAYTDNNDKNVKNDNKKKINKRKRPIPDDYKLEEKHIKYANSKGISTGIEDIFEAFCVYHRKRGTQYVSWYATWQSWILNKIKWDKEKQPPKHKQPSLQEMIS